MSYLELRSIAGTAPGWGAVYGYLRDGVLYFETEQIAAWGLHIDTEDDNAEHVLPMVRDGLGLLRAEATGDLVGILAPGEEIDSERERAFTRVYIQLAVSTADSDLRTKAWLDSLPEEFRQDVLTAYRADDRRRQQKAEAERLRREDLANDSVRIIM